jgi:hypothetical protein
MVAEAFEHANLRGEALNEYAAMSESADLSGEQQALLRERIVRLRQE